MKINRRESLKGALSVAAAGAIAPTVHIGRASAQSRAETLRHVTGATFTSLDPTLQGATRESFPLSVNVYDRLVSFERKQTPDGLVFDYENIRGEIAERVDRSADSLTFTFHIRQGATWHDGAPIEVEDIKWSLDRAVTAPNLAKAQMANGSMTSPEQFKVVGERQLEIKLAKPDRLALGTLCVPFLCMFNSKLAKKNATADDPWATAWLKENTAAGGAYVVESNRPGQQVVLKRNDNWKNGEKGQLPYFQRVIIQTVPDVSSRANLLERGDADLALDAAANDIPSIEQRGKAQIIGVPQKNVMQCIAFNTHLEPFNNRTVRAAIAAALPYEDMFKAAIFGRGERLFGAKWEKPTDPTQPQPMPLNYDLDRAKSLLKEAGLSGGFKTTFSFPTSASATVEPMAALIKESLAKIGVDVTVQKMPDAQLTTQVIERRLQMFFDFSTAWLPTPDYITRVFFSGSGRWNASGWNDPDVERLANEMRYETDKAVYDSKSLDIIQRIEQNVPMALLWHPYHDAVVAKNIQGYTYWFHRGADYRDLRRV